MMSSFFVEFYSALAKTCKKNWLCTKKLRASTVVFNKLWAELYSQYSCAFLVQVIHETNDKTVTKLKWSYFTVHLFWKYYLLKYEIWDRNIPQCHCLLGLNLRKVALKMFVYIYVAMDKWKNQKATWHYDIQK